MNPQKWLEENYFIEDAPTGINVCLLVALVCGSFVALGVPVMLLIVGVLELWEAL